MPSLLPLLGLATVLQASPTPPADHAANPVYRTLRLEGIGVGEVKVKLPEPTFADGLDAAAGMAAIRSVAGDDRAARELLRDSVTAPFVLKTRDVKAEAATIRVADLHFVVHATLDEIDLDGSLGRGDGGDFEAGNMRFGTAILDAKALGDRKIEATAGTSTRFAHAKGRLLDRISVESTDRLVATRSPGSIVIAAATDPTFDADPSYPNQWSVIVRKGSGEAVGPRNAYAGGGSYLKLTPIAAEPGALFVEAHLAFVEPEPWFGGNPILRSKFALIAQDQVRQIRREIEKKRAKK